MDVDLKKSGLFNWLISVSEYKHFLGSKNKSGSSYSSCSSGFGVLELRWTAGPWLTHVYCMTTYGAVPSVHV